MFFDYIQQGIYTAGKYRIYYTMFARGRQPDRGPVFDPDTAICIGIGSIGERVFICGPAGTIHNC
ncbi:hypothetical protein CJF31_00009583 [Rutstroemia sp. NJR-2017a BVV2]|nr:hypothetical protein CJF31_00009583 [Rutstroemia sp. NJR-2017a BVV2]